MALTYENIIQRMKEIRKRKQRSIHDCAHFLNITKEHYLRFEEGIASLTLPEIELLSIHLGTPLSAFFSEATIEVDAFFSISDNKKKLFRNLWDKLISAKLAVERNNSDLTIDELYERTQISQTKLQDYEKGEKPVPLDDLLQICIALDLPVEKFFSCEWLKTEENDADDSINWQPEFLEKEVTKPHHLEDPYLLTINAMKILPQEDQAEIVKRILEKLKAS